MSERATRKATRTTTSSARRLRRLQRQQRRRRNPLTRVGTAVVALVVLVAITYAVGAVTGWLPVQTPDAIMAGLSRVTPATVTSDRDLVVRIVDGTDHGREVAQLARDAGFQTVDGTPEGSAQPLTRILVHDDDPSVVAAAADLRDLIGVGVIEPGTAAIDDIHLTVIVGTDRGADDPA